MRNEKLSLKRKGNNYCISRGENCIQSRSWEFRSGQTGKHDGVTFSIHSLTKTHLIFISLTASSHEACNYTSSSSYSANHNHSCCQYRRSQTSTLGGILGQSVREVERPAIISRFGSFERYLQRRRGETAKEIQGGKNGLV